MSKVRTVFLSFILCILPFGCGHSEDEMSIQELELQAQPGTQAERDRAPDGIVTSRHNAITRAVEKVSDAVCGINVTQIRESRRGSYYDDPFFRYFLPDLIPREATKSLGSGFLISSDGYVLTNEHVVHNAAEIVVSLSDGSNESAEIIGTDFVTDLALIKINVKNAPIIKFGDSDSVLIGEWVIALGNPFGLFEINAKPTVTVGVISAIDRDFGRQRNTRVYQDMIQTDAAINQGNSGGPLVNGLGEVIGLNTFIYTGGQSNAGSIGLGFAIPSNRILRVLDDLKKHGEVNRSWTTGLSVEDIPPMVARYYHLKSADGVIVTNIGGKSPAAEAGLEVGDVIIEVNGAKIQREKDIWRIIDNSDLRGGDQLRLKVLRDGKAYNVSLELREVED